MPWFGMRLAGLVVAEIEFDAPELVVRLQHVGRVPGSLLRAPCRASGTAGREFRRRADGQRWCGKRSRLGRRRTAGICPQVARQVRAQSKTRAGPPDRPNLWRGSGPSPLQSAAKALASDASRKRAGMQQARALWRSAPQPRGWQTWSSPAGRPSATTAPPRQLGRPACSAAPRSPARSRRCRRTRLPARRRSFAWICWRRLFSRL